MEEFPSFGKIHFSVPLAVMDAVQEMNAGDTLHIDGHNNREVPLKMKIAKSEEQCEFFVDSEQSVLDATTEHWTFVMSNVNGAMYLITGHQEGTSEMVQQEEINVSTADIGIVTELEATEETQYVQVAEIDDMEAMMDEAAPGEIGEEPVEIINIATVAQDTPLEGTTIDASTIERMEVENGVTVIDPAILERIHSIQNINASEADAVTALVAANDINAVTAMVTPTLDLDTLASAAAAGMNLPGDGTTQIIVSKDETTGMEQVVITRGDGGDIHQEYLAAEPCDDVTDPDYEPENLEVKTEGELVMGGVRPKKRPKGHIETVMRDVPVNVADVTTYRCYGCTSAYLDLAVLSRHFNRKHHGQLDTSKVETSVLQNAHICYLCNAATSCMKGYQSHLERVHKVKYVRRHPRKFKSRKSNRRSRLDPGAAVAYCSLCEVKRGFLYTMNLVYHVRKYHNKHPGYQAAHKAAMDLHFQRYKHKCLVQVYCEICNDVYNGSAVITHIDKVHTDLSPEHLMAVKTRAKAAIAKGYLERAKVKKKQTAACPKCHEKMTINYLRNIHMAKCNGTPMRKKSDPSKRRISKKSPRWTGPTPCPECGKVFNAKISYNQHMRNIHFKCIRTPIEVVKCEECGIEFATRAKLHRHMSSHATERPFECDICHKKYKTADVLGDHQRIVHRREYRNKCRFCNYAHDRKTIVDLHEAECFYNPDVKHEDGETPPPKRRTQFKQGPGFRKEGDIVTAAQLDEKLKSKMGEGVAHLKSIKDGQKSAILAAEARERAVGGDLEEGEVPMGDMDYEDDDEEREDGEILRPHRSIAGLDGGPPYKCPECDKVLKTKNGLYGHRRQQHQVTYGIPLTLFQCFTCDKNFITKHKLKMHMLSHTGEKLAECNQCHKKFRDAYTLKDHIQMVHLNIYKFRCKNCHQGYDKMDRLNKHMRLCTAETPMLVKRRPSVSTTIEGRRLINDDGSSATAAKTSPEKTTAASCSEKPAPAKPSAETSVPPDDHTESAAASTTADAKGTDPKFTPAKKKEKVATTIKTQRRSSKPGPREEVEPDLDSDHEPGEIVELRAKRDHEPGEIVTLHPGRDLKEPLKLGSGKGTPDQIQQTPKRGRGRPPKAQSPAVTDAAKYRKSARSRRQSSKYDEFTK